LRAIPAKAGNPFCIFLFLNRRRLFGAAIAFFAYSPYFPENNRLFSLFFAFTVFVLSSKIFPLYLFAYF